MSRFEGHGETEKGLKIFLRDAQASTKDGVRNVWAFANFAYTHPISATRNTARWGIDAAGEHLTSSLGLITAVMPTIGVLELYMTSMSAQQVLGSRKLGVYATFGGLGLLFHGFRWTRRKFSGVKDTDPGPVQQKLDRRIAAEYQLGLSVPWYIMASKMMGTTASAADLATGTAMATAYGYVSGGLLGYTMDLFFDLVGGRKSARVPDRISDAPRLVKAGLALAISTGSLFLTEALVNTKIAWDDRHEIIYHQEGFVPQIELSTTSSVPLPDR